MKITTNQLGQYLPTLPRSIGDANERNENPFSNSGVQLALSTKRDGVILEERYCNEEQNKIKHHRIPHNSKICVISEIRVPLIPQTAQV